MDLSAGASVGPYRIVGHLGAGGMGEVYRARDTRLDRDVAIKILPQRFSNDPSALKRFQREAKALAALSHPNILVIHDIGEHEGLTFVVMELLEGETLRSRFSASPPSCGRALEIITAVTNGLVAAHANGIIHRDLKPDNIFITTDERVKILDFGLAKRFHSDEPGGASQLDTLSLETAGGTILGTLPYMSPEQARGEKLDPRTDIFSTGVILYELLTGKLPFAAPSAAAIIHKIIYEEFVPPSKLKPELPGWIDPILNRALAKKKGSRYSSTAELLTDLQRHRGSPTTPTLQIPLPRIPRLIKARTVIAAALLVLVVTVFAVWFFKRQAKVRWAREQALPQIEVLMANSWRDSTEAYKIAEEAEKYIPNDPKLVEFFAKYSLMINVQTQPAGARAYVKEYNAPDAEWRYVGVSPLERIRVPIGVLRWKLEKDGYETVLAASTSFDVDMNKENLVVPYDFVRVLDEQGKSPPEMVRVAGAQTRLGKFADFYIDRYEVTNRQYKRFVDSGGYGKKEFWKNQFVEGENPLTWEQAMARFVDQTNRPGPATWQAGDYPEGQDEYPVSGISWYEAAAFAEFAGKSLPTQSHWGLAAGEATPLRRFPQLGGLGVLAPFSNFLGKSSVKVGSLQGITPYGACDMAGNVREWCWNETPKGRLIRGGAWGDNTYMFKQVSQAPAMDRDPKNGFRCAVYPERDKIPSSAFAAAELPNVRDFSRETPVPDSVFQIYKEQFAYDKSPLNAQVETKRESPEGWILEKITFDAAYGERIIAYLFLPKNFPAPYQTVIYFPGSGSAWKTSSQDIEKYNEFPLFLSFIVRSGRAVLYPVYKGTFERRVSLPNGNAAIPDDSHAYSDYKIQLIKDFRRSIDYLESRPDILSSKIAYYGMSWGGQEGAIIPAVEDRLQSSILLSGGFAPVSTRPEVDPINYVTRVKIPTLMLNGKYDTLIPYDTSIKPFFELLGTPKNRKELKLYETDHIPPRNEFIKETLAWLDRHLGPIR